MTQRAEGAGAAFVMGGTGGLGRSVSLALAEQFEAVFFTYRSNESAARALAAELGKRRPNGFAAADAGDAASIRSAVGQARDRFGRISAVVMAHGAHIAQPFVSQIDEQTWCNVIDVELMGFIRLVEATLPLLRERGGAYVALSSMATRSFPPGDALSAIPKAVIEMMVRAIAKEEGRSGIRANCVAPGIIDAGLGAEFLRKLYGPEVWEAQRRKIALKRFGTAEDVAEVVAFLASNQSRYVTGQTLFADGGFHL